MDAAQNFSRDNYGASIVGTLDTPGQGYGNPADVVIINGDRMLVTTTTGRLLIADINVPLLPQVISVTGSATEAYSAFRVDAATEFSFYDSRLGSDQGKSIIDIAVTSSFTGKINTVDISDPYDPQVLGTALNYDGAELDILARDIMVSKEAGLAYIAASNAVYIIDIKDPLNPRLVFKTLQVATNADDLSSLVFATGIIEKDGALYVADSQTGLKILNTELKLLKHLCEDLEFSLVSSAFCKDYYPALGEKAVILTAFDENKAPLNAPDRVKLMGPLPDGVHVRPHDKPQACTANEISSGNCRVTLEEGKAKFYVKTDKNFNDYNNATYPYEVKTLELTFKVDPDGGNALSEAPATTVVELRHRDNANVRLAEVLSGKAVYTYDLDRQGFYEAGVEEQNRRFYYVQELINQVVPRKRSVQGYQMIDEEGLYDQGTATAIGTFKTQFNVSANTANYETDIYQKIMKDYVVPVIPVAWLNGIIDKETLIGEEERTERSGANAKDAYINEVAANIVNDTGLYELYHNVVKPFTNSQIDLAENYANYATGNNVNPWVSRKIGGAGVAQSGVVAYSYGGRQTIEEFNSNVSIHGAPDYNEIENDPVYAAYQAYEGNIQDAPNGAVGLQALHGIVGGGDKMWTGLKKRIEYHAGNTNGVERWRYENWVGIDCIGLSLQSLRYAERPDQYGASQYLSDENEAIPGIEIGSVCVALANGNCTQREDIHKGAPVPYPLLDTNVEKFFSDSDGDLMYYWPREIGGRNEAVIHRGDMALYRTTHISTIYSQKADCDGGGNCNYEIIHASGYDCLDLDGNRICENGEPFNRKVVVNDTDEFNLNPRGFGRIKLWD